MEAKSTDHQEEKEKPLLFSSHLGEEFHLRETTESTHNWFKETQIKAQIKDLMKTMWDTKKNKTRLFIVPCPVYFSTKILNKDVRQYKRIVGIKIKKEAYDKTFCRWLVLILEDLLNITEILVGKFKKCGPLEGFKIYK